MSVLGWGRLVSAIALVALAGMQVAASGAQSTSPQATSPLGNHDALAFPRTYHIWGGHSDLQALARYDMVVGYAFWPIEVLRKRNPHGIFLLNAGLHPGSSEDYRGLAVTYGAVNRWGGGLDRLAGGPKLGFIRPFNADWDQLHDADGSLARVNDTFRHGGWNLADPTKRGTPALVAKVIAHASKKGGLYRRGWDGIHSDNWIYRIGVDWFYGSQLDTDRDGKVDDYGVLRRNWAAGLTRVGLLLRSFLPGKIVGGNGNWNVRPGRGVDFRPYLSAPDDHFKSANYTLLEGLELYSDRVDDVMGAAREWLEYGAPRGQRRYFAILHRIAGGREFKSMRWGLTLATIAGAHYEAYSTSHADLFWYDEYTGGDTVRRRHWLGKPTSAPTKLSTGVWRRDFRNGIVLNNPTSSQQTIALSTTYWRLK
jgi:hypothetical protein